MSNTEHSEILKEYQKQREMEHYQQTRTLATPKTTYAGVIIWAVIYIVIIISVLLTALFSAFSVAFKFVFCLIFISVFSEFYLRFLGIKTVECYQHYAKEETRRRCLCIPSCSEYAILCFKKFGLLKALIKIRKRLYKTCKGDEYKIDYPR